MAQIPGNSKLWDALQAQNPADGRLRPGVRFQAGCYQLPFLGLACRVCPGDRSILLPESAPAVQHPEHHPELALLLLSYLTGSGDIPPARRWVSEKELPGGSLFFRGPHALPLAQLAGRFGRDRERFLAAAVALGGEALAFGDAAASLPVLPSVPLALVLWLQDEEFPARVTAMFDPTVTAHLALDVILAMVGCTARLLAAAAR